MRALASALVLLSSTPALADLMPRLDDPACDGRKLGAACVPRSGKPGVCTESTCSYSLRMDQGTQRTRPCIKCVESAPQAPAPSTGPKSSCASVPGVPLELLALLLLPRRRRTE